MYLFTGHRIIQKDNKNILVLYMDPQLAEFASDFLRGKENQKDSETLEKSIQDYIKNNLPNLKIATIQIMIGSMLIASLAFGPPTVHAEEVGHTRSFQAESIYTHSVKRGDTLYKIALKYGTTASHIASLNNLKSNVIYIGQQLKIIDPNQRIYTIKSGDTLYKIASLYNVALLPLKAINGLVDNMIYAGQKLYIPDRFVVSNPTSILTLVNKKYALPSDYIPANLVVPNIPYAFKEYDPKKLMRKDAATALEELFRKAKQDNIKIHGISGYRSYARQDAIFTFNVQKKGLEAANQFSAKPGESEHQTGLAIDLTSPSVNYILTQGFGDTKEGKWLKENAPLFGFIIRYPKGKESITGYQYEPWHIRYVGISAAKYISGQNITLEEYLGKK